MILPGKSGFSYTDASRETFDAENKAILTTKTYPNTIFFGDSLLWYMPLKKTQTTFSWANRAIPGDVTTYMAFRFEADVLQLKPKRLVFLGGVNDVINALMKDAPYTTGDVQVAIHCVSKQLHELSRRAHLLDIDVFLGTILPIETPMGKQIDNELARAAIMSINDNIKQMCREFGYQCIDFYELFVDKTTGYLAHQWTVDGIHLKKIGYQTFCTTMLSFLQNNH